MTAMPQMVAAFNGVGGGAAAVVSITEFLVADPKSIATYKVIEVVFGVLVGAVSFSGSAPRLREAAGADAHAVRSPIRPSR